MDLDGALGDEESQGDLAVRGSAGREVGYVLLAWYERVEAAQGDAAWAGAGGQELAFVLGRQAAPQSVASSMVRRDHDTGQGGVAGGLGFYLEPAPGRWLRPVLKFNGE